MSSIFRLLRFKGSSECDSSLLSTFGLKESSFSLRRNVLHDEMKHTLDSTSLYSAVKKPEGLVLDEWVVMNLQEFYNDLSMIWGMISSEGGGAGAGEQQTQQQQQEQIGVGFPKGFEYRWDLKKGKGVGKETSSSSRLSIGSSDGSGSGSGCSSDEKKKRRTSICRCSGKQYVSYVMEYGDESLERFERAIALRGAGDGGDGGGELMAELQDMFKKLFRVYAIIYAVHFSSFADQYEEVGLAASVNTALKHFLFFCFQHSLVDEREFMAISALVGQVRGAYDEDERAALLDLARP
jgi:hypothetical protein